MIIVLVILFGVVFLSKILKTENGLPQSFLTQPLLVFKYEAHSGVVCVLFI